MSWSRRVGVAGALLLMAGVSVAFAAQVLRPGTGGPTPSGGPSQSAGPTFALVAGVAPPVLDALPELTRQESLTVSGRLVTELPQGGPFSVRVYVNDERRGEERVGRRDATFSVGGIELDEGENTITAVISGEVDQTAPSAPVTTLLDSTPPRIQVVSPATGSTVYGETMLLDGTTEANAELSVANRSNSAQASTTAGATGEFSVLLPLRMGSNTVELTAVDEAGNVARKTMTVARAESEASVTLSLSRDTFELATLPQTMSIAAEVDGPNGQPLDDADVTFSVSVPGQMTVTYDTITDGGMAVWADFPLTAEAGLTGTGLVTVLVTLPGGDTLAESASFTID